MQCGVHPAIVRYGVHRGRGRGVHAAMRGTGVWRASLFLAERGVIGLGVFVVGEKIGNGIERTVMVLCGHVSSIRSDSFRVPL